MHELNFSMQQAIDVIIFIFFMLAELTKNTDVQFFFSPCKVGRCLFIDLLFVKW